jgi:hypothetical protein
MRYKSFIDAAKKWIFAGTSSTRRSNGFSAIEGKIIMMNSKWE